MCFMLLFRPLGAFRVFTDRCVLMSNSLPKNYRQINWIIYRVNTQKTLIWLSLSTTKYTFRSGLLDTRFVDMRMQLQFANANSRRGPEIEIFQPSLSTFSHMRLNRITLFARTCLFAWFRLKNSLWIGNSHRIFATDNIVDTCGGIDHSKPHMQMKYKFWLLRPGLNCPECCTIALFVALFQQKLRIQSSMFAGCNCNCIDYKLYTFCTMFNQPRTIHHIQPTSTSLPECNALLLYLLRHMIAAFQFVGLH